MHDPAADLADLDGKGGMSVLTGCRILVVEDEYLLSRQLTRALEREGASVTCVPTVPAALASLAEASAPDVAVLDVNLAGTKVYPVAEELVQHAYAKLVRHEKDTPITAKHSLGRKPATMPRTTSFLMPFMT